MILSIVKRYMTEKGVEVDEKFESKEELLNAVKKLNPEDKKTLNGVVKKMDNVITKLEDTGAEKTKNTINFLENAFLIAATTMTVAEIAEFLDVKINGSKEDNTKPRDSVHVSTTEEIEVSPNARKEVELKTEELLKENVNPRDSVHISTTEKVEITPSKIKDINARIKEIEGR